MCLKGKKKKLALTSFYYVSREIWLANLKKLICIDNQDSIFHHTRENSKMFSITSKYFSFFNNKPPANWIAHITRDFLTYYSCSYYSFMIILSKYSMPFCLISEIIHRGNQWNICFIICHQHLTRSWKINDVTGVQ